jgi:hypothetical protein
VKVRAVDQLQELIHCGLLNAWCFYGLLAALCFDVFLKLLRKVLGGKTQNTAAVPSVLDSVRHDVIADASFAG